MTKAVILAGGRGTRLAPYTFVLPKPLMPVGEMPILEILLRRMKISGVDHFIFCVGYGHELIRTFFGDGSRWGVQIDYSLEDEPLGTAGPLSQLDGLKESFLVANGDLLTDISFDDMLLFHRSHGGQATIGTTHQEVKIGFGVMELDEQQRLVDYREKPTFSYLVSIGLYVLDPVVLRYVPCGEYLDLPDLMNALRCDGQTVRAYIHQGYWFDIGRVEDYQKVLDNLSAIQDRLLAGM
ncbi:sugar phosphate nucleotidyltransferase [Acidobacteria bacterium AH-259-A15]|nr:sugar phosphate nucleotidyltransferase [Acidobacteria bacterium AH-259-A15]